MYMMKERIFFDGFLLEDWIENYRGKEISKKLLVFKFNNGRYVFAPKWSHFNEMFCEMLKVEDFNFSLMGDNRNYSPYIQDLFDNFIIYLEKNPKYIADSRLKRLKQATDNLVKLNAPNFNNEEVVQIRTTSKPEIIQLEKKEYEKLKELLIKKKHVKS